MEVKIVIKTIVKASQFGEISLLDLEKEFRSIERVSLRMIAGDFGFDGLTSMIKKFPELSVVGSGLNTKVRYLETDHKTEMNRHSK